MRIAQKNNMSPGNHIINKQLFEFECLQSEHAFQLKNKFDHDVQYKLTKVIERVCDHLSPANEDIKIPLLEIDLGRISFSKMEDEVVLAFEKHFYEKLLQQKNDVEKKIYTGQQYESSSIEIIKCYLLTGQLPWYAGKQEPGFIDDLFEKALNSSDEELRILILSNLGNEKFIERLMTKYEGTYIERIIGLMNIEKTLVTYFETLIRNFIQEIKTNNLPGPGKSISFNNIYQEENDKENVIEGSNWLYLFINEQSEYLRNIFLRNISVEAILKAISAKHDISNNNKFYTVYKTILQQKLKLPPGLFETIAKKMRPAENDLSIVREMTEKYKNEIGEFIDEDKMNADGGISTSKFYISNAGLILLANYLPLFFKQLDLLDNGDLTDKEKKIRAVFLLHYLSSGSNEAPEYILPLNKILCGLALDEPLPSIVPLNDIEKNECDELLNEVILNWQRVGSLSIDGLRDSFINRDGILEDDSNGWKLTIERRGYDVLLDSMPWSFTHTKLSWMQELIITEW